MAGLAGIVIAFFLDPESGEGRRDKAGKSFRQMMRKGRKQMNSTSKTLRKVAS
jgi:hypothetical protein